AVAADISGEPLGRVLSQGTVRVVSTETRFGEDWLLRLVGAAVLGVLLFLRQRRSGRVDTASRWAALAVAVLLLASLASAGHGGATAGAAGDLHLAGDALHLIAAGFWLGTLPPLALLLALSRRSGDARWLTVVRTAVQRYSVLAIVSVIALLAGGILNTWFLAGTIPALVGTEYGRLLLAKIALFLAMLTVASVNLLRLTPRLAGAAAARAAYQLRRNALIEAALGLGVLGIVGLLGILPPGLHAEPGWPFPIRLNLAALSIGPMIAVVVLTALAFACAVAAVAAGAAGRYRLAAVLTGTLALCAVIGWAPLRPAIERAYPTSFYAPAQPYAAPSVVSGAKVYDDNCATCHGASGKGNGPAAAGLPIRPADLTDPHLFAHNPGDLFWWVSHGKGGAMPGFAKVLKPSRRWDAINFILARAAGDLVRQVGPKITTAADYPVPDFAFEKDGKQSTLRRILTQGPVLLVLFAPPAPLSRLQQFAAAQPNFSTAGLQVLAVGLDTSAHETREPAPPYVVRVSSEAISTLKLFRATNDGGETELMLDRAGNIRVRWTANIPRGPAPAETLVVDAERVARIAAAAPTHAGHMH
ncbi:MAG: CopD family protein, partial [Alphaproteobacteria bacterium]|nr:CopD family protein [Alphaproteobacteria bacterium]